MRKVDIRNSLWIKPHLHHTYFHYGIVIENALHNDMNIFHFSSLCYYIIYYNLIYIQLIIISDKLIILHVYICK